MVQKAMEERSWGEGSDVLGGDRQGWSSQGYPTSRGHSKSLSRSAGSWKGRASFPGELRQAKQEGGESYWGSCHSNITLET